jgi:hypothetical protein
MTKVLLAPLIILLTGQSLAFAPQSGLGETESAPANRDQRLTAEHKSGIGPAQKPAPSGGKDSRWQGSVEYLLWWFKDGSLPPLVTAGGNGKLGSPGTRVLVDNLDFTGGARQGVRFDLAYHARSIPWLRIEANYFFVGDKQRDASFSSDSEPVLAQPFIDAVTGIRDATLVASPGLATGAVSIGARTSLWGG